MPDVIASSLSALPFDQILGAPLLAAIEAQSQAALATVDFINSVGFDSTAAGGGGALAPAEVRTVSFRYSRTDPQNPSGPPIQVELTVPLLTIVPIPYIRVADLNIDFELKVHQLIQTEREAAKNTNLGVEAKAGFAWFKAKTKLNVTISNKSTTKSELDRSATLRVALHAVQDEIPEGLSQVLTLLRDGIIQK